MTTHWFLGYNEYMKQRIVLVANISIWKQIHKILSSSSSCSSSTPNLCFRFLKKACFSKTKEIQMWLNIKITLMYLLDLQIRHVKPARVWRYMQSINNLRHIERWAPVGSNNWHSQLFENLPQPTCNEQKHLGRAYGWVSYTQLLARSHNKMSKIQTEGNYDSCWQY